MKLKKINWLLIVLIIIFSFTAGVYYSRGVAADNLEQKLKVFLQVLDLVKNDYVDKNLENTTLIYGAIRGVLESLDDPYTRFMEPKSYQEMKIRLAGSYSGIGIYIGMKEKQLAVIVPIEGTPAAKAGLIAGDKIVEIDKQSTRHMALEEAVSLIRGPKGTLVTLAIIRGEAREPKEYKIPRDNIVVKSLKKEMLDAQIGYIKLNTFENQNAAEEMKNALVWLQEKNAGGLILDLRGNGGGLLHNAIEIAAMFVDEGVIVSTVGRDGEIDTIRTSKKGIWHKPLAVIIDETSASASEILAGAIQDNRIGTVVGTHSFGKASVQNVRMLGDGSALLLTIARYKTPSGRDISKKGIEPDLEVKIDDQEKEKIAFGKVDLKNDLQLQRARQVIREKIADENA